MMRALRVVAVVAVLAVAGTTQAVVIDFVGGTAYLESGGTYAPTDTGWSTDGVDYYIEDGVRIDFIGGPGVIGNYYRSGPHDAQNSVIHAHWSVDNVNSIVFSKVDGSTMDVNYMDITSNCRIPGGQQTGTELSYVTPAGGTATLLPSSDWGFDYDYFGNPGDGVERLWLGSDFDGITHFTVTSQNAFCFGMDNFYIDEPAPPTVPDGGATLVLLSLAMAGLAGIKRRE